MQSWPYAKAVRESDQKNTRLGLIRMEGVAVGLMALQEVKLGPIHFISLLRGPLWFAEHPDPAHLAMFAEKFDQEFPRKIFRRRRWLPEWQNDSRLSAIAYFRRRHETYATSWVDLKPSPEELRHRLNQKWRNALDKSERFVWSSFKTCRGNFWIYL